MKKIFAYLCSLFLTLSAIAVDWEFATADNPAVADTGAFGQVIEGPFSSGWWGDPFLGTANSGFWDLGASGIFVATLPQADTITIRTLEWFDGDIYNCFSQPSVPGFTVGSQVITEIEASPFLGGWYEQTLMLTGPLTAAPQLTLTGCSRGTLLNRIVVDCAFTSVVIPTPITVPTIRHGHGNGRGHLTNQN